MRASQTTLVAAAAVCLLGCFERQIRPVNPCTTSEVQRAIDIDSVDQVDLLFMVDNSNSMSQEQELLRAEIPRVIRVLASGDLDGDGTSDFTPVRSLHVGIITSDLGSAEEPSGPSPDETPSCDPGLGDDGIMRNTSRAGGGCLATYPSRVFAFTEGDDPSTFAATVGCVADLGTDGCGFEQQLEATLKALSPDVPTSYVASGYVPPQFYGGTLGHGGPTGANAGFLREESILAVVLVTDEEDCSVPAYDIFYLNDPDYTGNPLNLRCSRFSDRLHDVQRYVGGLSQLRENPGRLVYAVIGGVPTDLPERGATYEEMLADPRLAYVEEAVAMPTRLVPSCDTENGEAFPPRRMIEVAAGLDALGARTTVQSICGSTFVPAIDAIIENLVDALSAACLPRALNTAADGRVGCDVYELLPAEGADVDVAHCADVGLELVEVEVEPATGVSRELCLVPQIVPTDAEVVRGWYYDDRSEEVRRNCGANETPQRIAFSLLDPPRGAEIRLNCSQTVLPSSDGVAQLGTFCTPFAPAGPENLCPMGVVPSMSPEHHFDCDPIERSCGVSCSSDADCSTAGLLSYVCDTRTVLEVVGDAARVPDVNGDGAIDDADAQASYAHCINPSCGG